MRSGGQSSFLWECQPQAFVLLSHDVRTVTALETAHDEVSFRKLLEMLGEHHVDGGTADRAGYGDELSRCLLCDLDTKACADLSPSRIKEDVGTFGRPAAR